MEEYTKETFGLIFPIVFLLYSLSGYFIIEAINGIKFILKRRKK